MDKLESGGYNIHFFGLISEKGTEYILADIRTYEKYGEFGDVRIVLAREIRENKSRILNLKSFLNGKIPYREPSRI